LHSWIAGRSCVWASRTRKPQACSPDHATRPTAVPMEGSSMPKSRPSKRHLESVYVIPPHGAPRTLAEAIAFIESFDGSKTSVPFTHYEVGVRYSNGDEIRGLFKDKATAVAFLCGI